MILILDSKRKSPHSEFLYAITKCYTCRRKDETSTCQLQYIKIKLHENMTHMENNEYSS